MKSFRKQPKLRHPFLATLGIVLLLTQGQSLAGSLQKSCYDLPGVEAPKLEPSKGLYVFIDQTMAMTVPMKTAVIDLVSEWGKQGERVFISRFSANIKGNYTELMFDEIGDTPPSEAYLFHLRYKDKKIILACLESRKDAFHDKLATVLNNTLKLTNDKLPHTNLMHSLMDFSEQLIADRHVQDKTILLVSDGLENSDVFSFHKRGSIRQIDAEEMLNKVRRQNLIPNWYHAKIYLLGLGYISDDKEYIRPKIMKPLKRFWMKYFLEGTAEVKANSIGTPMLLTKTLL